jgi:hypothetical protein
LIFQFGFIQTVCASIKPKRIKVVYHDLSKPGRIEIIPNMATFFDLPCAVQDVAMGSPDFYKSNLSKIDSHRMWIIAEPQAKTSNMIVHCENMFFVFDLIVQELVHSDVVQIAGIYNGPEVEMNQSLYQDMPTKKVPNKQAGHFVTGKDGRVIFIKAPDVNIPLLSEGQAKTLINDSLVQKKGKNP